MGKQRGGEDGAGETGEVGRPPGLGVREARRHVGTGLLFLTQGVNGREPLCGAAENQP